MEIVLEVSEKEDYSEFPITGKQTVEITSKNKQEIQHREITSLASERSEKKTEDKSTQTISRRVWRKIKKKDLLRQQNAIETTSQSSNRCYRSCSFTEVSRRTERIPEGYREGRKREGREITKNKKKIKQKL